MRFDAVVVMCMLAPEQVYVYMHALWNRSFEDQQKIEMLCLPRLQAPDRKPFHKAAIFDTQKE